MSNFLEWSRQYERPSTADEAPSSGSAARSSPSASRTDQRHASKAEPSAKLGAILQSDSDSDSNAAIDLLFADPARDTFSRLKGPARSSRQAREDTKPSVSRSRMKVGKSESGDRVRRETRRSANDEEDDSCDAVFDLFMPERNVQQVPRREGRGEKEAREGAFLKRTASADQGLSAAPLPASSDARNRTKKRKRKGEREGTSRSRSARFGERSQFFQMHSEMKAEQADSARPSSARSTGFNMDLIDDLDDDADFGGENPASSLYPRTGFHMNMENDCCLKLGKREDESDLTVPRAVHRLLYPHQVEGVKWLGSKYLQGRGAILADDMGLGKTIQVIAFLLAVLRKSGTDADKRRRASACATPILIVCPSSIVDHWIETLVKWGHFRVQSMRSKSSGPHHPEIWVCSYHSQRSLPQMRFDVAIFDEVHKVKNPTTGISKASNEVRSRVKFGLTGTPIQNNYEELWAIMHLTRLTARTAKEWEEHFSRPLKLARQKDALPETKQRGRRRVAELKAVLDDVMLKRNKSTAPEIKLPGKSDTIVFTSLSEQQKLVYQNILALPESQLISRGNEPCPCGRGDKRSKCCFRLPSDLGMRPSSIFWRIRSHVDDTGCEKCPFCCMLPLVMKLQQVCSHPYLLLPHRDETDGKEKIDRTSFAKEVFPETLCQVAEESNWTQPSNLEQLADRSLSGKLHMMELLLNHFAAEGRKVLLFSYSTKSLDIIQALLVAAGYRFVRLDGTTPTTMRQSIVDSFNDKPSIFVLLMSTKAGGLGLNATAATRVIIFDVNWNPTHDAQAQDRAYRIGQKRKVKVFRLVAEGSIEELTYMHQVRHCESLP